MKLGMPKPRWVKVLIQEFEGNELIDPNQKHSKYLALCDTSPQEVYDLYLRFLRSQGIFVKRQKRKNKYTLSPEGRARKVKALRAYWRKRKKEEKLGVN